MAGSGPPVVPQRWPSELLPAAVSLSAFRRGRPDIPAVLGSQHSPPKEGGSVERNCQAACPSFISPRFVALFQDRTI